MEMKVRSLFTRFAGNAANLTAIAAVLLITALAGSEAFAQQHVSKRFPAGKGVRLELKNLSGLVEVESWNRNEIRISATLESPGTRFDPRQLGDELIVDLLGDNRGRDVGDVNFKIQLPVNSSVDVETRRGDIKVTNMHGGFVRARVSTEGDITLAGINASQIVAQSTTGNIYFDGEFASGGMYEFQTTVGEITIRIPGESAFKLVAASSTRQISLGQFWNKGFQSFGNGRKYVGDVGDGRASVSVTNLKGSITFLRR
jgi:hypothetical protein